MRVGTQACLTGKWERLLVGRKGGGPGSCNCRPGGEGASAMRPHPQRGRVRGPLCWFQPVPWITGTYSPGSGCFPAICLQDQEPSQIWLQKPCSTPQAPLGTSERGDPGQLWPLEDSTETKLTLLWSHCRGPLLSFGGQRFPRPRLYCFTLSHPLPPAWLV